MKVVPAKKTKNIIVE